MERTSNKKSLLALDVGTKRVGVAICNIDKTQSVIIPLRSFSRANQEAERAIINLISDYQISTVIIGLPLNEDNSENDMCLQIQKFARRLSRRVNVNIEFVDEYGTTYEASERLSKFGKITGDIDAQSAVIILEEYLRLNNSDENKRENPP
jgi:putative Holliday junction resolvase